MDRQSIDYGVEVPEPAPFTDFNPNFADFDQNPIADYESDEERQQQRQYYRSPRRFWKILAAVGCLVLAVVVGASILLVTGGGSSESSSQARNEGNSGSIADIDSTGGITGGTTGGEAVTSPTIAPTPDPLLTGEVFDIIVAHSYYGGKEFKIKSSYQYQAFKWVRETSVVGVHSPERVVQRYALACIYYATNAVRTIMTDRDYGDAPVRRWIDEEGWLVDDDECTWYRLECNEDGFISAVKLYSNRITGSFPPELTLLKDSLEEIDLFNNPVFNAGPSGNDWLGELTNLKKLFYGSTNFQYDGIPTAIGKLTNLEEYDCSFSLYFGPLDGKVFKKLDQLVYLYIGGNSYNSSIPMELAELPNLQFFYAEYTDLIGDLDFLEHMPSIAEIWIDRNPKLVGTIPTEIGTLDTLKSFSVSECGLTGEIPTELGLLRLQQMWLYSNDLSGTIPTEFGELVRLKTLALEDTSLTGSMPDEVCMNRNPDGLLAKLDADCDGEVECSCCTCCGVACTDINPSGGRKTFRRNLAY